MPWPPSLPSTGFVAEGYTTIVWGTDYASSNAFSGYIVVSVRSSERNEEVPIPNGTGLTATQILLKDGYNYEITVIEDTAVTPPIGGQAVSLQVPGIADPFNFMVIDNNFSSERKAPGQRTIMAKSFTLFNVV